MVETALDGSVNDGQGTYMVIFIAGGKGLWFQRPCLSNYSNEEIVSKVMPYVDNIAAVAASSQYGAYPGVASHTALDIDLLQEICSYCSTTQ
eukprot:13357552-Ditylum_brightwellii.AAC.1